MALNKKYLALFHFFFVEMRPIYFFYLSTSTLLRSSAMSLFMMSRSAEFDECQRATCRVSMNAMHTCIWKGVSGAMWSLDFNYTNEDLCTRFHGDNIVGYIHVFSCFCLVAMLAGIGHRLMSKKQQSFTSGRYIRFTKGLPRHWFIKVTSTLLRVYIGLLLVMGILVPFAVIPERYLAKVGLSRVEMADEWVRSSISLWVTVAISGYFLAVGHETAFNYRSDFFDNIEFQRSWYDLMMQRNSAFCAKFEAALLRAVYGDIVDLQGMLVDKSPGFVQEVIQNCAPLPSAKPGLHLKQALL
eukprot:TRINITY_DN16716_c0_g2_i1.p1 TRINITY_DN16716_c0_g2~~TRINITY_DN16716_c0_g2_i1.p1  ORF type:complete len:299 (+),score=25.79 TRINITY_DN16716_c0_g2_i1:85-981(+)